MSIHWHFFRPFARLFILLVTASIFGAPESTAQTPNVEYFEIDGVGSYTTSTSTIDGTGTHPGAATTVTGPVRVILGFNWALADASFPSGPPSANPTSIVSISFNNRDITSDLFGPPLAGAQFVGLGFDDGYFQLQPTDLCPVPFWFWYSDFDEYQKGPQSSGVVNPDGTVTYYNETTLPFVNLDTYTVAVNDHALLTGLPLGPVEQLTVKNSKTYPVNYVPNNPSFGNYAVEQDFALSVSIIGTYRNAKCLGDATCRPGGVTCGDPIDVATGNVYRKVTDYQSAGQNKLTFDRYYNSMGVAMNPNTRAKALGVNWRSTYDRYLSITTSGTTGTALAERPDGQVLKFTLANGTWGSDSDVNSRLSQSGSNWLLTTSDDTVETYTASGTGLPQLNSIRFQDAYCQTLSYNGNGQLFSVADTNNRRLTFGYYPNGLLQNVTLPDSTILSYSYTSSGVNGSALDQLASIKFPTTPATGCTYTYGNAIYPFALMSETDELGNVFTEWGYDDFGRGASVSQAENANSTQVVYNNDGTSTVTGPLGQQEVYHFDTLQGVPKVTEIDRLANDTVPAASEYVSYDANGYIGEVEDWNGNTTVYTNDLRGNELSRTLAYGTDIAETTTTTWHPLFNLPVQISDPLLTITFVYDAVGNLRQRSEAANGQNRAWNYTYDAYGQILTATDPGNNVTTKTYDAQENLTSITDALQHQTLIPTSDANGLPLTIQDPNKLVTTIHYDVRGNIKSRTVGTEETDYTYDVANNLKQITLPDNSFYTYGYDNAHRLTSIADTLGNSTVYTPDNMGHHTATCVYDTANILVQSSAQAYDALGRQTQRVGALDPEAAVFTYDNNGNQTSATDPLKHQTISGYDALNRLEQTIDAKNGVIKFGYDARNRLTGVTDPRELKTTYKYLGPDNLTSTKSPDAGTTTKSYDNAGNPKKSTSALGTIAYTYDALNRLSTRVLPGKRIIKFGYDEGTNGIGHLTSLKDLSGATRWQYDAHGRVTERDQTIGSVTLTTKTDYDTYGRVRSITYPSGHVVAHVYDPVSGLLTEIDLDGQSIFSDVVYQPFGPVASWTEANGATYTRSFDADGRIYSIVVNGPSGSNSQSFGFDDAGNIRSSTDSLLTLDWKYGYDELNRLGSVTGNISESFTYDGSGNRLTLSSGGGGGKDLGTSKTSNRLISMQDAVSKGKLPQKNVSGQKFSYNGLGEMTSDGVRKFSYDALGEMTSTSRGASIEARYVYNGLGQRVKKSGPAVPGGTVLFQYDESGMPLGEYDKTGEPIEETIWLGDLPIGVIENGSLYFINADQLGAPHTITDQTGNIVWQWTPEPFGNSAPYQAAGFSFNMRFPGQYADAETGLYYNNARSYSPTSGRYVESDPLGLKGGSISPYVYVGNNSVNCVDRFGLCETSLLDQVKKFASDHPVLTEGAVLAGVVIATVASDGLLDIAIAGSEDIVTAENVEARGGTYLLRDAEGNVARTGRTNDLARRELEHARDPALKDLDFEPVHRTDVYEEQRGLEQLLHDTYNPPLNKLQPISPSNPNFQKYMDAADAFLKGGG